jgi:arginine utilization protein RocB
LTQNQKRVIKEKMTNKQILEQVYVDLLQWRKETGGRSEGNNATVIHKRLKEITNFIEQEWQKADDMELMKQEKWFSDVREMERYRGLEIGEDGTVKE